jgi:2-haloacid dehalogenase
MTSEREADTMPTVPKALLFDVFGTCVDWRSGVARAGEALGRRLGITGVDWLAFADAWRDQYQPQMETVRNGQRPWVTLDVLHRESLDTVLAAFGLEDVPAAERDELTLAWHRLDPWPDVVEGLTRLKTRYVIAPCSNGHIALMVTMAKRAGLPWDAILGAEIARAYKPQPAVYLRSVAALGLEPRPGVGCAPRTCRGRRNLARIHRAIRRRGWSSISLRLISAILLGSWIPQKEPPLPSRRERGFCVGATASSGIRLMTFCIADGLEPPLSPAHWVRGRRRTVA